MSRFPSTLLLALAVSTSSALHNSATTKECIDQYDDACFYKLTDRSTYRKAQEDCVNTGGNLASIHNMEENGVVKKMCRRLASNNGDLTGRCWIGMQSANYLVVPTDNTDGIEEEVVSDATVEEWEWADHSDVTFMYWVGGASPDVSVDSPRCAIIRARKYENGSWKHSECSANIDANDQQADRLLRPSICKRNPAVVWPSCAAATDELGDGAYMVDPDDGLGAVRVYCEGSGIVFQRRSDDSVNFYRGWDEYEAGFGYPGRDTEWWLGLDSIHRFSTAGGYNTMTIDLANDNSSERLNAAYSTFAVGDASSKYRLTATGHSGNTGDQLSFHNGKKFSTFDQDNDTQLLTNCAEKYEGAWWYANCFRSDLNNSAESKYMWSFKSYDFSSMKMIPASEP